MTGHLSWSLSAFYGVRYYWSNPRKWAMEDKGSISAKKNHSGQSDAWDVSVSFLQRLRPSSEPNWRQRRFGKRNLDSATSVLSFKDVWGFLSFRGGGSCFVLTVLLLFLDLAETPQSLLIEGRAHGPQASRQLVFMHTDSNMSVEPRLKGKNAEKECFLCSQQHRVLHSF